MRQIRNGVFPVAALGVAAAVFLTVAFHRKPEQAAPRVQAAPVAKPAPAAAPAPAPAPARPCAPRPAWAAG